MVVECLVELEHVFIDKLFTYLVPSSLEDKVCVGMRVEVPFGKQVLEGFVLKIHENNSSDMELKEIISLVDDYPILTEELIKLGSYMSNVTLSSLMSCYQAMLPKALKAKKKVNINKKYEKYVRINPDINLDSMKFNKPQLEIINYLKEVGEAKKSVVDKISSSLKTLVNNGIVIIDEKEVSRFNLNEKEKREFLLNDEQNIVYDEVVGNLDKNINYLLYGVTGSGKTNVYMKIIEEVIKRGKSAIVLVPEISLTPQIINRFTSMFSRIAVLHSGLSDGEKYDEYRKIINGNVDIVIGARSAIFAPLKNLGVIIIDEEHSSTYKQENTPRYSAIDIAKERAKYHNCPLIMGSATPSLDSFARALKGVYKLLTLKKRYNNHVLPHVDIVDMNKEFKKSNGYFSNVLVDEINNCLKRGEQVILFLNRRGYTSVTTCSSCGNTMKCPNCDISLTYHKTSNMLRCHYCGYATKREDKCRKCESLYKEFGLGTQKVEEEIQKLVYGAKIVRMDVDTTTKKSAHEKIVNSFLNGEYNILLGTQMIAKGLDFPNVTLVGVINADISLNFPDFRSSEITFQLLNQVSGRSGRGEKEGKVIIQTFNPEHYAIRYAKDNDYVGFYKEEMEIRRKLKYPPYFYLCHIRIVSMDYNLASSHSIKIAKFLREKLGDEIILGPSVSNIFKINNRYRFQIIIKYKNIANIIEVLKEVNEHYFNDKKVRVEIDFNPLRL